MTEAHLSVQGDIISGNNLEDLMSVVSAELDGDDFDGSIDDFLHETNELEVQDEMQFSVLCNDLFGEMILEDDDFKPVDAQICQRWIMIIEWLYF